MRRSKTFVFAQNRKEKRISNHCRQRHYITQQIEDYRFIPERNQWPAGGLWSQTWLTSDGSHLSFLRSRTEMQVTYSRNGIDRNGTGENNRENALPSITFTEGK